ncbi:wax ester/triacylglycerol synthase domain-containing protein [Streptomyces sp. NPDC005876]|uniref:wax ester/triacylglycerol synthase domain-containing protein n=1 Tax=Streptomyces sp. NPDC005876 TaxID=3157076 RepID=UPI0033FD3417
MQEAQPIGGWSSPGPMNGTDTLFWRMGTTPLTRPHVTWVWFLDTIPDWTAFLDGCRWIVGRLPRLTHRVAETTLRAGTPAWTPDLSFRVTRHVHRMRLPDPAGPRELLELVEWRNSTDFDPLHPPWEATLVEGYERDRAAIVLKWHHSVGDAVTIVSVMNRLLSEAAAGHLTGDGLPRHRAAALPAPGTGRGSPASAGHGVANGAKATLREAVKLLTTPRAGGTRFRLAARSAARLLAPVVPSPLLRERSADVRCGMATVPLADLKAAGKAAGVSVTSAYVATVLAAFQRYHAYGGVTHTSLPTLVPVNIRRPAETGPGNIIASVRIAGPIGDMPEAERMAAVHTAITEARDTLVRELYTILADLSSWVPGPVHRWVVPPALRSAVDLVVTSVPGFAGTTFAAGCRVTEAVAWAPRGGAAANVSMASHDGTCGIGTNLDPAAVTDPELFHHCLEQSLRALGRP